MSHGRKPLGEPAMAAVERSARYRATHQDGAPRIRIRGPADRRSKAQRWRGAVAELVELQEEYDSWFRMRSSALFVFGEGEPDRKLAARTKNVRSYQNAQVQDGLPPSSIHGSRTRPDAQDLPRASGRNCKAAKVRLGGKGHGALHENRHWKTGEAAGSGTIDRVPDEWRLTAQRLAELFDASGFDA